MCELIIKLDAKGGADLNELKNSVAAALITLDGVESLTVHDGREYVVRKKIPVFTGEALAGAARRGE